MAVLYTAFITNTIYSNELQRTSCNAHCAVIPCCYISLMPQAHGDCGEQAYHSSTEKEGG